MGGSEGLSIGLELSFVLRKILDMVRHSLMWMGLIP